MKRSALCLLIMISLVAVSHLGAQTQLKAAVGLALPPYIIQDSDNGLEVDIVREALKGMGYTLKLDFVPFARVPYNMQNKVDDCALTINEGSGVKGVYYSDSHVTYQNVVVTLKSRGIKIKSVADLGALTVVAFQSAPVYLGQDFAAMAKGNSKYSEISDQQSQVKLLFVGRADAIVMDINIFKYFRQEIKDLDVSAEVEFAPIFGATNYKVAFVSKAICDRFNIELKKLRDSGKYAEIFKRYIK